MSALTSSEDMLLSEGIRIALPFFDFFPCWLPMICLVGQSSGQSMKHEMRRQPLMATYNHDQMRDQREYNTKVV